MTDVFWEWFCSLFPEEEKEVIDPYTWRCVCGHTWKFSKWQLLRMFLFENYTYTCPQCQRKGLYRMSTHVVRDIDTDEIKEHNRWLD